MSGRNSKQQQQAVLGVLDALMPPNAPTTFRKIFPLKQVQLFIALAPQPGRANLAAPGICPTAATVQAHLQNCSKALYNASLWSTLTAELKALGER